LIGKLTHQLDFVFFLTKKKEKHPWRIKR